MRWYDQMSASCAGCLRCVAGEFPDGTHYRACRWYGYIFHEERGVTDAVKVAEPPRPKSIRQMGGGAS